VELLEFLDRVGVLNMGRCIVRAMGMAFSWEGVAQLLLLVEVFF
jgi:hypothetical protein